jgi:hypothetical protein
VEQPCPSVDVRAVRNGSFIVDGYKVATNKVLSLVNDVEAAVTTGLIRFRHMLSAAVIAALLADCMWFTVGRTHSRDVDAQSGAVRLGEFECV